MSKTQTVLCWNEAATWSPRAFQHTSNMPPAPSKLFTMAPSLTDQMCKNRSKDPLAMNSPLGEKATLYTGSEWLASVRKHEPVSTSQSLMVVSNEAVASSFGRELPGASGCQVMVYISF